MTRNFFARADMDYLPSNDSRYWDEKAETMDPEERQELILHKIRNQMEYAYQYSDFYHRKWSKAGIHPKDIRTMDDFHRVPFVTKEELREDQREHAPFGSNLCVPWEQVYRIYGTSGTTGNPTVLAVSLADWERIATAHARIMWWFGLRPSDTVFIASVFSLYIGSWGALIGCERLHAKSFPFGAGQPGQTERAVSWIKTIRPTAFYGTPSYALYLAEIARSVGVDPLKDFNFRIMFFSGEPGAGIPSTKKEIEKTFGCICIDTGSMAEMTPWMTDGECESRTGMTLWQDIIYTEVVSPYTKNVVPFGGEGVPIYTHLERDSQPMIRLWSGDLTTWTNDPCPCGRTYPRLPKGIYGRVDDMLVIRGVNVYPSTVEDILRGTPDFGGEFRIEVARDKYLDSLSIQVEFDRTKGSSEEEFGILLKAKFKQILGVSAKLSIVDAGSLERTEFKSRRIIDHRKM